MSCFCFGFGIIIYENNYGYFHNTKCNYREQENPNCRNRTSDILIPTIGFKRIIPLQSNALPTELSSVYVIQ